MRNTKNALRRLDYVFTAVDQGSFRQAARVLHVRESSVSRNVVALEQFLDMQLFERSAHGVRPTGAGRAWIDVARTHYEGVHQALAEGAGEPRRRNALSIGISGLVGRAFLTRLIHRFRDLYPEVGLVIEDISHGQCLAAIRRRRLDVVFVRGAQADTSCCSETFGHERLFVLLPVHHPLANEAAITWADLADERLLMPACPETPSARPRMADHITAEGAVVQTCGSASEMTAILKVQLGQGVILAGECFARSVAIDATTWLPLWGENSVCPIKALWLGSNPKRALLRLLGIARNVAGPVSDERGSSRHQSG